ncbi:hypothetical protein ACLB2K_041813 [Fragaria x ananassa]
MARRSSSVKGSSHSGSDKAVAVAVAVALSSWWDCECSICITPFHSFLSAAFGGLISTNQGKNDSVKRKAHTCLAKA